MSGEYIEEPIFEFPDIIQFEEGGTVYYSENKILK